MDSVPIALCKSKIDVVYVIELHLRKALTSLICFGLTRMSTDVTLVPVDPDIGVHPSTLSSENT